ncbi:aminoglycoside phosphotransferase family protein [Kitasatospora sp. NPDC006786]|uniref:phosphotransferase family protein n=1 Tax=unclassified Kitasatospora TaxID=2633591 RepID=UPI0033D4FBA6
MNPDDSCAAVIAMARRNGLDPRGAVLLHGGPHHTWRLPRSEAVAKVWAPGTAFETAARDTRIAKWLLNNGIRAPRPAGNSTYPLTHSGRYHLQVSFSEDLGDRRPGPADLADVLRRLHTLPVPAGLGLARFDPCRDLAGRIRDLPPGTLAPDQERHLRAVLADTRTAWRAAPWGPPCVIHGDATPTNCIMTPHGPALIDFERTATGPRQWDQAAAGWARDVYGTPPQRYEEFARAYGDDVTAHDAYRMMTPVFGIAAWLYLAECARTEPGLQDEADRRLATVLTAPLPPAPWGWLPASRAMAEAVR